MRRGGAADVTLWGGEVVGEGRVFNDVPSRTQALNQHFDRFLPVGDVLEDVYGQDSSEGHVVLEDLARVECPVVRRGMYVEKCH